MDSVDLLYELVSVYSPSGHESAISNLMKSLLAQELEADRAYHDNAGNIIGVYEGKEPTILLCGHIDTVPGELPVRRDHEFIYGRGAVDAKAAMAAFLCAAYKLKKLAFQNKVIIAGVVGEEDTGNGIRELIKGNINPSFAVFGEPCSLTNIVIGYRGGIRLEFDFRAESFHSSSPWLGKSAVDAAIELWAFIRKYNELGADRERKFDTVSTCLTKISGGESHNMTPAGCKMTVDVRFPPSIQGQKIVDEIEAEAEKICGERTEFSVRVEDFTPAYTAPVKSELVKAFKESIKKITGTDGKLIRKTGSGDMNIFGKEVKAPAITFGAGDPKLSHTPYEKVSIMEYLGSIEVIKEALVILSRKGRTEASQAFSLTGKSL
ncbi:MAG: M20/M25/M40 family metallo-hydrolase [Nitrososphaeria archaeon]